MLAPGEQAVGRDGAEDDEGITGHLPSASAHAGSQGAQSAMRRGAPGVGRQAGDAGDDALVDALSREEVGLVGQAHAHGGQHQAGAGRGIEVAGHPQARQERHGVHPGAWHRMV